MGLLDKVKGLAKGGAGDKVRKLAEDNADKITSAVDKATDVIDAKTKGKYTDKLDKVDDAARKALDKTDDEFDGGPTDGKPPA